MTGRDCGYPPWPDRVGSDTRLFLVVKRCLLWWPHGFRPTRYHLRTARSRSPRSARTHLSGAIMDQLYTQMVKNSLGLRRLLSHQGKPNRPHLVVRFARERTSTSSPPRNVRSGGEGLSVGPSLMKYQLWSKSPLKRIDTRLTQDLSQDLGCKVQPFQHAETACFQGFITWSDGVTEQQCVPSLRATWYRWSC